MNRRPQAHPHTDWPEAILRGTAGVLTVITALVHLSLGGLLFTMNAVSYSALAVALLAPLPLARRVRWLIRPALLGFTSATILGWLLIGPRFSLAYVDKSLEVGLIVVLMADIMRADGGPIASLRRLVVELWLLRVRLAPSPRMAASETRLGRTESEPDPERKVA